MAITRVKNYNVAPYYDDFDESKNYHRVLFRPGFAVQARELTQLQTALQSQVDKLGQYNFNDGSRVVGGKVSINTEYDFIKLTSTSSVAAFVGTTITGGTNGVTADVLEAIAASGSDPDTLYIKYTNSGTDKATELFANGETISNGSKSATLASSSATGKGSRVSIEEGAYFISGTMAYVASQSMILDKYTNTPNYIIGLSVTESLVESGTDSTLVDNATGTPNFAAPGAHRYKIATALIKENLTAPNTTHSNYILLMKVKNGVVEVKTEDKTANTELTARLARRTHEESGNYSVTPFTLDIREHLDDEAGNGGYLTAASGGSATKLAVGVEPSVAYVQGFRVENLATKYVVVDKPRDHVNENEQSIPLQIGNYVNLTLSTVRGMPDINSYTTIELRNSSSTKIGEARVRGFEVGTAAIWRLYLFDIVMNSGQTFSNVAKVFQTQSNQDFQADLENPGVRFDSGNNGMVFKLPYDGVKTLLGSSPSDPLEYNVRKEVEGTVSGSGTSATVSFTNLGGNLQSNSDIIIATAGNAAQVVPPACVSGVGTTTLTLTNASSGLTGFASGTPHVKVICTVQKQASGGQKAKTLTTVSATNFTYSSSTGYIPLDKSDIYSIDTVTVGGVDAKDKFKLDNGQRDNFYDEGRLTPVGGWLANGTVVTISFKYWLHSGAGDYFSVDSYGNANYEKIGTFDGNQGKVELRDCLDFRPTKASSGSITAGSEFTTGTGFSNSQTPKPGSVSEADVDHYIGRIDKLYIDREGNFKTVTGVAATNPQSPDDIDDSMTIFELHYQPYVFDTGDCIPVKIDSKRYTMRDIGSIDTRVRNLEYYTSLSLLEKDATSVQIQDGSNNDRLKNGIIVDGFYGHNVGNVRHPDYHNSIDKTPGLLRPKFYEDNTNLIKGATTNVTQTGSLLHLPFSEAVYIDQPYATFQEFVNPYNVFTWGGTLELSPESDEWKDTDTRPDVIIDDEGVYDQLVSMAEENGILGTVWNEWETNWTGVEVTETTSRNMIMADEEQRFTGRWRRRRGTASTTTVATTTTSNQARTGLRTTVVPDTQLKELGSRVVETNFVPFMRSREIFFKAEMMKPNTKVYAFFNGTNVTDYCSETGGFKNFADERNVVGYKGATSHANNTDLITSAAGVVEGSFRIPHNASLKFKTGTREFRLTDSNVNDKNNETTFSEALYHAQGLLEVKENVIMSTKVPRFVSTELTDDRVIQDIAITRFTDPVEWVDPLAQTFVVQEAGGVFMSSCEIYIAAKDANLPIRLSIRSVENGTPTQQIVPGSDVRMYPGADRDASGDGLGDNIQVSTDGSVATKFVFDHPVYLGQDQEYAIVLISMSDDYKVFVAEVGGFDLQNTANRVTKQPYNGVFFTSANASTWTPEQTKDLKFKLNKCNFTQTSGTVVLNNDTIPAKALGTNPIRYVGNSGSDCIIRVTHRNHGMFNNSSVTLAGFSAENGIAANKINANHTINNVEHDSYAITITGDNATTVGIDGGGSNMTATENKVYNVVVPQIQTLEVPGTGMSYSLAGRTGQSQDGAESPYASSTIGQVLPNSNNILTSPHVIASARNEAAQSITANTSFALTATLNGTSNLTPIIDLNRCSVTTIANRTNDAGANSGNGAYNNTAYGRNYVAETESAGTSELNSYITKRIDLNNESSNIDVYISANKPKNANIDLYYKTLPAGSDLNFDDQGWILDTPETAIPDNDGGGYNEAHYSITPSERFGSFAIKVTLRTTNSSYVPSIKDFRAIASI